MAECCACDWRSVSTALTLVPLQLLDKRLAFQQFMLRGNPRVILAALMRNMVTGQPGNLGEEW